MGFKRVLTFDLYLGQVKGQRKISYKNCLGQGPKYHGMRPEGTPCVCNTWCTHGVQHMVHTMCAPCVYHVTWCRHMVHMCADNHHGIPSATGYGTSGPS